MDYILLMTGAGSLLYAGLLLAGKAMGKHMSNTCRFRVLSVALFAFIVPWGWFGAIYAPIRSVFVKDGVTAVGGKLILGEVVYHTSDGLVATQTYGTMMIIMGIWLAGAVLVMIMKCGKYFKNKSRLMKRAEFYETNIPKDMVQRLKRELRIKGRVKIGTIPSGKHSFTLGVIRPVVFVQEDCTEYELEQILRHELTHIARGDLLIKLLMELVCCLHWFNLIVYKLNKRLDRVCEQACDERVGRGMSEDEKAVYARLVIRSMVDTKKVPKKKVLFGNFLTSDEEYAEERIRDIMLKRKGEFWEKIVVAGVFAVMVFANSLTALAYPQVSHVENASDELAQAAGKEVMSTLLLGEDAEAPAEVLLYDEQIVTADGQVYPAQSQLEPQGICFFHNWQDAKYQAHIKNEDNTCEVQTYACEYCTKCTRVKLGELLSTVTYNPCPHEKTE